MAKDKCECEAGAPAWMTTFSDLMSLLLCFFVLLVSMSKIVKKISLWPPAACGERSG